MKVNTRYYCCSAIDLMDWVYSFSVLYVAMYTSTGIFTQCPPLLLLSSTHRHFGWEVDPLCLIRPNNTNDGQLRILSSCPQNNNA